MGHLRFLVFKPCSLCHIVLIISVLVNIINVIFRQAFFIMETSTDQNKFHVIMVIQSPFKNFMRTITTSEIILKSGHSSLIFLQPKALRILMTSDKQLIYKLGTKEWMLSNVAWAVIAYKSEEERTVRYLNSVIIRNDCLELGLRSYLNLS